MNQPFSTRLRGLIAAAYTPLRPDGSLWLEQIPPLVEHLIASGVSGLYVCGSTGEGMSLTDAERREAAGAFASANGGRLPLIVQVGHNSLKAAGELACHAREVGADAVSATCPSYYKIHDVAMLVDCMAEIASAAPELRFYYYHIPSLTGSQIDMVSFLHRAGDRIPNLAGLKYTHTALHEFQQCLELDDGRFDVVWGCDEMLLGAWSVGAVGAIGSTYNFAAPIYRRLIEAFERGDLVAARRHQRDSIALIRTLGRFPFHAASKALLGWLGTECGPVRLPQPSLTEEGAERLREDLESIGYSTLLAPDVTIG